MGPLDWLGDDAKLVFTLVLEVALAVAILRFVVQGRRGRAVAGVVFLAFLAAEGVAYDFLVAARVVERDYLELRGAEAFFLHTETRFLHATRLRIVVFLPRPDRDAPPPPPRLGERGTFARAGTTVLSGVDRIFVIGADDSLHEIPPVVFSDLWTYERSCLYASFRRIQDTPAVTASILEITRRTNADGPLRELVAEDRRRHGLHDYLESLSKSAAPR